MNKSLHIREIRSLLEDGSKLALAHVDNEFMFEWVHPKDIQGMNNARLALANSNSCVQSVKTNDCEQDECDDSIIVEYMLECTSQRKSLDGMLKASEFISPLQHLEALLFMAVEFETQISYTDVNREDMCFNDFEKALVMIETVLLDVNSEHVRNYLVDFTFYFFCYSYVSPELYSLPELNTFMMLDSKAERLDKL